MLLEIQGLRGVAILGVLLFHLWPKSFPNGYVGVDMFFVISGYLMAMVFSKYDTGDENNALEHYLKIPLKTVLDFYYKRAKRILPLYYLAVPLIFTAGHLWLAAGWIRSHNIFGLYSMVLLKNMKTIWDGSNYFLSFQTSGHQKDLFLHLWSLAVEIQFYLIAPLIFFGCQLLKKKTLKLTFLVILSVVTCCLYYYSNPIFSFNYPFSRLWQFGLGAIAFIFKEAKVSLGENEKQKFKPFQKVLNEFLLFLGFVPLVMILISRAIPPEYMRPLGTLSCFVFLSVGNGMSKKILTNKFLTYTGNISYSLYLIHWPVIVLFKQSNPIQFVLGLTIVLSVLSYHFYENTYRKFSITKTIALLVGLVILNVVVYRTFIKCHYVTGKMEEFRYNRIEKSKQSSLIKNVDFMRKRLAMQPRGVYNSSNSNIHRAFEWPWGIWDLPKGNGSRKIMVIGNSYTINEMGLIHETFKGNYSEFKWIAGLALQILADLCAPGSHYTGQHEAALQLVEEFKPDILFAVSRLGVEQLSPLTTDPKDDLIVQAYNRNMARLEKNCGRILIQGPSLPAPLLHLSTFIDAMTSNVDLKDFHMAKETVEKELMPGEIRYKSISCKKCQFFDVLIVFKDGRHYLTFDPDTNLSFFDDDVHFTMTGLDRLRPVYRELISQL